MEFSELLNVLHECDEQNYAAIVKALNSTLSAISSTVDDLGVKVTDCLKAGDVNGSQVFSSAMLELNKYKKQLEDCTSACSVDGLPMVSGNASVEYIDKIKGLYACDESYIKSKTGICEISLLDLAQSYEVETKIDAFRYHNVLYKSANWRELATILYSLIYAEDMQRFVENVRAMRIKHCTFEYQKSGNCLLNSKIFLVGALNVQSILNGLFETCRLFGIDTANIYLYTYNKF